MDALEVLGCRSNIAARYCAIGRDCMVGVALMLACQSAVAQAMYRIKPLGTLGGCTSNTRVVEALNRADQATGEACNANGDTHAFLWKNNGTPLVDLGPPEVGSSSEGRYIDALGLVVGRAHDSTGDFVFESSGDGAPMKRIYDSLGGTIIYPYGINDLGQITGDADTAGNSVVYHAFVWKNDGSPMLDLGTLGGNSSTGFGINALGQVTGNADLPGSVAHHAFLWKNDGSPLLDLGTLGGASSSALFINASGQVAGVSSTTRDLVQHAFFWRNDGTPMQDLGTLGGPYVGIYGLNDSGQVAGVSYTHAAGRINSHAFIWMNDGMPIKDLGTLGGTYSAATAINSAGQVTGSSTLLGNAVYHPFLWRNDGTKMQDLNNLIDPTDPLKPYVTLALVKSINDLGDVVGQGIDSRTGLYGLYLLQGTVLTLAPRSLAFGSQPINTKSAAKSVTVTNTSAKVVAITSIALKGAAATQFASSNNCGSSLVGHATCTIKVSFKPTTKGTKAATLNVNGGGEGLRSVSLKGNGT